MKTRYLLPLATLLFATAAHADRLRHQGPGPDFPERAIERLDERAALDLSDSQKEKIKTILGEERTRHDAIRQESQQRIDKVLTAEQRAKRDQHLQEVKARHAERLQKQAEYAQKRADTLKESVEAAKSGK